MGSGVGDLLAALLGCSATVDLNNCTFWWPWRDCVAFSSLCLFGSHPRLGVNSARLMKLQLVEKRRVKGEGCTLN